jgi:hypothetical protein
MKERKSMRGVSVDLGKLMAQQEKNIAVGNTKSNARGDQLGRAGRVVKSADEISREHYNRNNPRAVKQSTIKVDDDIKSQIEAAQETKETAQDDWEEPVMSQEATQEVADIMEAAEAAVEDSVEEDEWVEDAEGNFVRKSELENDKPVSKSKTSRKKR